MSSPVRNDGRPKVQCDLDHLKDCESRPLPEEKKPPVASFPNPADRLADPFTATPHSRSPLYQMSFEIWKTLSQISASKSEAVQKFIKEFKLFSETRAKARENLKNPDPETLSQLIQETQILEKYAGLIEWVENLLDQFPTDLKQNAVFKEIKEENPDWARAIENFSRLSGGLKTPDSYSAIEIRTTLLLKTFEEANLEPFWKRIHAEREKEIKKDPHYQTRKQMADWLKELTRHLTVLEKLSNHQTKPLSPAGLEEMRQNLERSLSLFSSSLDQLPQTLQTEFRRQLGAIQQGDIASLIAGTELAIRIGEELLVAGMKKENLREPSLDLYYDRLRRDITAKDTEGIKETLAEFFNRLDSLSLLTSVNQTITSLEEGLPSIEAFYRERPRQGGFLYSSLEHYKNVVDKLSEIKKLLKEENYDQAVRKFTALNTSQEFKNLNLDLEMAGIHVMAKGMALALLTVSLAGVVARLLTLAMIPRTALAVEQAGAQGAFLPTTAQIWGYRFVHGGNFVLGERLASNAISGEAVFRERGFAWNATDLVEDSILMTGMFTSAGAVSARFVNFARETLRLGEAGQQLARMVGVYVGFTGWEGIEKSYEKGVQGHFAPLKSIKEVVSFAACRDRGVFLAGLHFVDQIIHPSFNPLTRRLLERAGRKALKVQAIQLDHERVAVLKALNEHPYLKESGESAGAKQAKLGSGAHLLNRLMGIAKGRLDVLKTLRRSLPDGTPPQEIKALDEMIAQEEQAYKNVDQFKKAVRHLNKKKHPTTAEVGKVFEERIGRPRIFDKAASRKKIPRKPVLRRPKRGVDPAARMEKQALDFGRRHFGWKADFKPDGSALEAVKKELERRRGENREWIKIFLGAASPEEKLFAAVLLLPEKTKADPQTIESLKQTVSQANNLNELWEGIGTFSKKQIPDPNKSGKYLDIDAVCVAIFDFHFEKLPEAYGIKAKVGELLKEVIVDFGRRHFGFETSDRDATVDITHAETRRRFESEKTPDKEWMENFWKTAGTEDKKMALYLYTGKRGYRFLPPGKAQELLNIIGQHGGLDIEVSADLILRDDGTFESVFMRGEWDRTKVFGAVGEAFFPMDHTHPDHRTEDYAGVFPSQPDFENVIVLSSPILRVSLSARAMLEKEGVTVEEYFFNRVLRPDGGVIYLFDSKTNTFHLFFGVKGGNKDPYRPAMRGLEAEAEENGWKIQWHDLDYEKIARRDLGEVRETLKGLSSETLTQKLLSEAPPLPDRNDPSEKHWLESSRVFTDYVRRLEKLVREGTPEEAEAALQTLGKWANENEGHAVLCLIGLTDPLDFYGQKPVDPTLRQRAHDILANLSVEGFAKLPKPTKGDVRLATRIGEHGNARAQKLLGEWAAQGVEEAAYELEKLISAGASWAFDIWKEAALKNSEIIRMWRENVEAKRKRRGWDKEPFDHFLATFDERPLMEAIDKGEFRQLGGMSCLPPPVQEKLKPHLKNMPVEKLAEAAVKGDYRAVGQLKVLAKSYQNEGAQTALANLDCAKYAEDYAKKFGQPEEITVAMILGYAAEAGNPEALEILLDQAERGSELALKPVLLLPMAVFIEKIKANPQDTRSLRLVFDVAEMGNDGAVLEMESLAKTFPAVRAYLKVMPIEKTVNILENGPNPSAIRAFRTICILTSLGHEKAEEAFGDFMAKFRSGDKRAQEIFAQLEEPAKDSSGGKTLPPDTEIARILEKHKGHRGKTAEELSIPLQVLNTHIEKAGPTSPLAVFNPSNEVIALVLGKHKGDRQKAAEELRMSPNAINQKIHRAKPGSPLFEFKLPIEEALADLLERHHGDLRKAADEIGSTPSTLGRRIADVGDDSPLARFKAVTHEQILKALEERDGNFREVATLLGLDSASVQSFLTRSEKEAKVAELMKKYRGDKIAASDHMGINKSTLTGWIKEAGPESPLAPYKVPDVSEQQLAEALAKYNGNHVKAAEELGLDPTQIGPRLVRAGEGSPLLVFRITEERIAELIIKGGATINGVAKELGITLASLKYRMDRAAPESVLGRAVKIYRERRG